MHVVAILAASASLALFSATARDRAATLAGTVQDINGAVIVGATVEVGAEGAARRVAVATDAGGRYDVRDLPPGDYSLKIASPGFRSVTVKSIRLSSGQRRLLPVLRLAVAQGGCRTAASLDYFRFLPADRRTGNLAGRVEAHPGPTAEDAPPVAGARVDLVCAGARLCAATRTDSRGRFTFRNLSPANYAVRVRRPDYYPEEEPGYQVQAAREFVYRPLVLERCDPANCDPRLRPKRLPVVCE